jgi:hypothetical protein
MVKDSYFAQTPMLLPCSASVLEVGLIQIFHINIGFTLAFNSNASDRADILSQVNMGLMYVT